VIAEKRFPDPGEPARAEKRFSGYSAVHYRVQLKEQDLSESEQRYAAARIEVQVASVLMHAWAEVEHDLAYKPLAGDLSEEEYSLLNQLNGLVIAGEIALERLQKAGEARVAINGRRFENHYDLAVHLLSRAAGLTEEPINESGLGRVDLLFGLISELGIDTPDRLATYLSALHGNVELRPLAEQIIDALLAEDASRYDIYRSIRAQRRTAEIEPDTEDVFLATGIFLSRWIELERLTRNLSGGRPVVPTGRQLRNKGLINPEVAIEYDQLRQLRNQLVHGIEAPPPSVIADATERVEHLEAEIGRRMAAGGDAVNE
jgi:hypothetical protein